MPGRKVTGKKSCPYPDGMIDSLFQMLLYPKQMSIFCIVGGPMLINKNSINEVGEAAFEKMLRVLNGEMTRNEAIQYFTSIDIHCLGPVI